MKRTRPLAYTPSTPLRCVVATMLAMGMALVTGCAAPTQSDPGTGAGATAEAPAIPYILVPPSSVGTWYDLGEHLAPWLSGDMPVAAAADTVPTRVAGLRRNDGRWLAIVLLQQSHDAGAVCPPANSLHVTSDRADDCIRLRRDADYDGWLQQQHPILDGWVRSHGWNAQPRAWISSRVPNPLRALEAQVLVDPALIEGATRSNTDFLEAGGPGFTWARQFATATRSAADGHALRLPPFPFAAQVASEQPSAPAQPIPTQAEQIMPKPNEAPAPRQDRQ